MNGFTFQSPWMLGLLLLLIPLALLLRRGRHQRQEVIERMGGGATSHPPLRDRLRLAALALVILALARPGADPRNVSLEQSGRDVVFALDVSQSMLAEDSAPSRLETAKQAVRDALAFMHGQRAALVVYAGSATILCPLTDDYDFIRYMLEQANPRTVDFGGSQWTSAIEKITGQVFDPQHQGFEDLVLLTDGEDHGPGQDKVAEMIRKSGAGLLIVGIGNPDEGARIPTVAKDGTRSWLEFEGQPVRTRMDREALTALAAACKDATFFDAGTSPFDLGSVYANYVAGRPTGVASGGTTIKVYRELAFWILPLPLLLLALAHRLPKRLARHTALLALLLTIPPEASAAWREDAASAIALQQAGKPDEAIKKFEALGEAPANISPTEQAAVAFNRGLIRVSRAQQQLETAPDSALGDARAAQSDFLEACRLDPALDRAARRLDPTAGLLREIRGRIEAQAEKNKEQQALIEELLKRLEALADAQDQLRSRVPDLSPRRRNQPPPPPPEPATTQELTQSQTVLNGTAAGIRKEMADLDKTMSIQIPGQPPIESIFKEPVNLMDQAIESQNRATTQLPNPGEWPQARQEQAGAVRHFREILDLFANSSSSEEGEGEDSEMSDEEGEYEESESDQAQNSSMPAAGDAAQSADMQPLPAPNYSVEDILGEEAASQQFREQKRAEAQAGKVKKDW